MKSFQRQICWPGKPSFQICFMSVFCWHMVFPNSLTGYKAEGNSKLPTVSVECTIFTAGSLI